MIQSIRLQNFRLYDDSAFDFGEGVNIIVGPNASGKTSLLEAVLIVLQGVSYKAPLTQTIRHGKGWARLDAHTRQSSRTVKIEDQNGVTGKTFEINKVRFKIMPPAKSLPVVLFEPEHLLMLSGRPDMRREYLDGILAQTIPGYKKLLRDYKRALAQRNRLLKDARADPSQIFPWDLRLSELGDNIAVSRQKLVSGIDQEIKQVYQNLSSAQADIEVIYRSGVGLANYGSNLLKKLEANLSVDRARGFTGFGPHRDDLEIVVDGHKAQETVSRGEARTILLALKMLEIEVVEELTSNPPVLLLDDVFSELDGMRRKALTKALVGHQTFITTTDADIIAHNFAQKCNIISIG